MSMPYLARCLLRLPLIMESTQLEGEKVTPLRRKKQQPTSTSMLARIQVMGYMMSQERLKQMKQWRMAACPSRNEVNHLTRLLERILSLSSAFLISASISSMRSSTTFSIPSSLTRSYLRWKALVMAFLSIIEGRLPLSTLSVSSRSLTLRERVPCNTQLVLVLSMRVESAGGTIGVLTTTQQQLCSDRMQKFSVRMRWTGVAGQYELKELSRNMQGWLVVLLRMLRAKVSGRSSTFSPPSMMQGVLQRPRS